MVRAWFHRFGPPLLVLAGCVLAILGLRTGDAPLLTWLGIALILVGGVQGASWWLTLPALALTPLAFASFLLPITKYGMGQSWPVALSVGVGFTIWEALPVLIGGGAAIWAARNSRCPAWMVFMLPLGLTTALSVWVPRPYHLSFGGGFIESFPELIWLLGSDLCAGLAMGTLALAATAIHRLLRPREAVLALTPLMALFVAVLGFKGYATRAELAPKENHRVMAIQGGLAPWSGGFAVQSKRALYPMIVFSSLKPDLVIFPENFIQTATDADPDSASAVEQRHYHAIGMGISVPYSQVLFGVRDFETSRLYFSDLIDGKPQVTWKDLWGRIPFVDVWPKFAQSLMGKLGRSTNKILKAPEREALMGLYSRDETKENGLQPIGKALVLASGEIRAPRLIERLQEQKDIVVGLNATVAGWCGPNESRASLLQANARLMELGLVGYRVGQLSGTEFFVPWRNARDEVKSLGNGNLTFTARIPKHRLATGYTSFFWLFAFYGTPILALGALAWFWLAQRSRETHAAQQAEAEVAISPAVI